MEEEKTELTQLSDTISCEACGAPVTYKAGTDSLLCSHCGSYTKIDVQIVDQVEELDYAAYVGQLEELNNKTVKVVNCRQCGAESTIDEHIKSTACPYCNTVLIEADIHEERLVQPSYVLPFSVDKEHVHSHMSNWMKALWFAPNKLKKQALHTDDLKGVYIPCWTYDANTTTSYVGQRGTNYTVTVGSGKNRRTEVRTRWSFRSGTIRHFFDDVMVPASKLIGSKIFGKIGGWDTRKLVGHDDKFLTGYITEKYTVRLQDGFQIAKSTMDKEIRTMVRRDIGGDQQRIMSCKTSYSNIKFKLILLPVFMSSYLYNNKLYHFYINGRNGTITGDRPYSVWKIVLTVLGIAAIVGLLAMYL